MPKPKKNYLEKKIEGIGQKYSKIPDQYSELKNIYGGKDKGGNKSKNLHKLKARYEAAEAYLQNLEKQDLTPEQRKYLTELARTFVEYDLKLDQKRKEPDYKESLRKKRVEHLDRTLESIALDEAPLVLDEEALGSLDKAPVKTPPTKYKTLDNYVRQPKTVTPIQPKIVMPPAFQASKARNPGPGLTTKVYNTTAKACSATGKAIKKYWKYGISFVAGAAAGSLLTYYCMTKPVVKPAPPEPPKQEQVIPKSEYVKPEPKPQEIIIKQEPKKETPVVKEEQKPVAPKVEELISEKDWTNKVKKGEIDLAKYDVFFSGMWYDPGAIVLHEKGNSKIKFDTAMSGESMWERVESKKELEHLVSAMEKNNMFGDGRVELRADYIKNKKGESVGVIFTDALDKRTVNQKDGKVMVYSIERQKPSEY